MASACGGSSDTAVPTTVEKPPGIAGDLTPIPLDSAVRAGTLGNGLTYYARSNNSPGSSFELRLAVKAGGLHQDPIDSGIAHFVEHMVFRGTEHFPGNELMEALERMGFETGGADVNARTNCNATVYQFSANGLGNLRLALDILDDIASAATFPSEQMDTERGVILEEARYDDTAAGMRQQAFSNLYRAGSSYEGCDVLGSKEKILKVRSPALRDFYDRWYRPDLMAVIVVGDLPADKLESEIVNRFADNPPGEGTTEEIRPSGQMRDEPVFEIFTHPEGDLPIISVDFTLPRWDMGTVGGQSANLTEQMIADLFQDHLDNRVAAGELALVDSWTDTWWEEQWLRFFGFGFSAGDEADGLKNVLKELRFLEEAGFSETAVEEAKKDYRARFDQFLASAATITDDEYAERYVWHYLAGVAADGPESAHARLSSTLDNLTTEGLNNHFRWIMGQVAPLVLAVGNSPDDLPSVDELRQAVTEAYEYELGNYKVVERQTIEALLPPPTPVDPIEINKHVELGATEFLFANGARVMYQYSDIAAGTVIMAVESLGGFSLLESGVSALVDHVTFAVDSSGVGDHGMNAVRDFLDRSGIGLSSFIGETSQSFWGGARSTELANLFALLHLRITEPRVDPVAFGMALDGLARATQEKETDPNALAWRETQESLYGGDGYIRSVPSADQLADFTAISALDLYRSRFSGADGMVVAVVGDSDYEVVLDVAKRYIGTLPAGKRETWVDRTPPAPSGVDRRTVSAGVNDASAGFSLLFPPVTPVTEDFRGSITVLQEVLENRLHNSLREELGISYGGGWVELWYVDRPEQTVSVFLSVDTNADSIQLAYNRVLSEISDLLEQGPSAAELEIAKEIVLSELDYVDNVEKLERLIAWLLTDGQDSATLPDRYWAVDRVEVLDVAEATRRLLPAGQRIEVFRE